MSSSNEKDDLVTDVAGSKVPLQADWGVQAHLAAQDHLVRVWEWFHEAEDGETAMGEDPAVAPFCGCEVCEVREILSAAVPFIIAGALRDNRSGGLSLS